MYSVRNLNYTNRKNPIWQKANSRANRYLKKLLLKEVLKMLPVMLLYKVRQYQKLVLAFLITLLFVMVFALQKGYAQTGLDDASFINLKNFSPQCLQLGWKVSEMLLTALEA